MKEYLVLAGMLSLVITVPFSELLSGVISWKGGGYRRHVAEVLGEAVFVGGLVGGDALIYASLFLPEPIHCVLHSLNPACNPF